MTFQNHYTYVDVETEPNHYTYVDVETEPNHYFLFANVMLINSYEEFLEVKERLIIKAKERESLIEANKKERPERYA